MSVILVDLGNNMHDVMINNAGWRETVAVLRSLELLDQHKLLRLERAWLGEQISLDEARAIGEALVAGPLAAINWIDNVYPPTGYWTDPCGDLLEYDRAGYWPSWLRAFASFCLTCDGFVAY